MATQTTNYGLIKPEKTDPILIDQINENMDKIDAALVNKVNEESGKGLSTNDFTDADKSKLDGLENYDDADMKADIAEVSSQAAINKSTLGYQRKNLLPNTATSQTKNGVTLTVNEDKSVTVNGTATSNAIFTVANVPASLEGKTVRLSGCPTGGNYQRGYSLFVSRISDANTVKYDEGTGVKISIPNESCRVQIIVRAGATANNLVFKPMLRYAEISDDSYEPYQPSVQEQIDSLTNHVDTEVKADIATVQEQIGNITDQIFGLGTNIPSGADLNNYTQAGVYYAETSTKAGTLLNVPYKQAGFRLEIYYQTNNQRFIQKLFPNTASGVYFHRVYASGGFGSWLKFEGTAVTT